MTATAASQQVRNPAAYVEQAAHVCPALFGDRHCAAHRAGPPDRARCTPYTKRFPDRALVRGHGRIDLVRPRRDPAAQMRDALEAGGPHVLERLLTADRKSTRLNSSHVKISYAVFCLKKKTRAE